MEVTKGNNILPVSRTNLKQMLNYFDYNFNRDEFFAFVAGQMLIISITLQVSKSRNTSMQEKVIWSRKPYNLHFVT